MTTTEELLALIDRLEDLLERSGLAELEVQAGELGIVLRKPVPPVATAVVVDGAADPASGAAYGPGGHGSISHGAGATGTDAGRHPGEGRGPTGTHIVAPGDRAGTGRAGLGTTGQPGQPGADGEAAEAGPATHAVLAPLTGIFYSAPSPGAAPYVKVGAEIVAGQVIGLIEAMKLFNEIKSDAAGRVVRMHATDGALVRAKQPLIEIQPA